MTIHFDREAFFLSLLQKEAISKGIGDDCCVLDSIFLSPHIAHIRTNKHFPLIVGADSFCEDVHFLREWFSPYELAYKAFIVNYSDIIAMNAKPLYATLSVALPKYWHKREIRAFVKGIGDVCRVYNITLIGGDTISADKAQIHITMFAKAQKHTLYRDRIPIGSILCYTSDKYPQNRITQSYKVLKNLLYDSQILHINKRAKGRFLLPNVRATFIAKCAYFLKGGMDISDGILSEMTRLCAINHCSFKSYISLFAPRQKALLYSGESYEMLIAIAPKDILKLKRYAAKYRIRINMLGTFTRIKHILPPCRAWH